MFYLIGLGLGVDSISRHGREALEKCSRVYLDTYTVDFPYSLEELEKSLKTRVIRAERKAVEGMEFLKGAKKENIALLVYGSPLTATTHITLIQEAEKSGIKFEVIFNASILDAIGETGLQIYKFGKITSMPGWQKNFRPESFMDIVKENISIGAHSLILVDIGLGFKEAIEQLEEAAKNKGMNLGKIVVCSRLGTEGRKVLYGKMEELSGKKVLSPFCIIIPGKMHFVEEEMLESRE